MKTKTVKLPRIVYDAPILRLLKQEFGINRKAVHDALNFRAISDRSDAIRRSAVQKYRCKIEYTEITI